MNLVSNSNARCDVLDNFNACKEFVSFETDALLITLTMKHFGMNSLNADKAEVIPPFVENMSIKKKIEWLYGNLRHMIEHYVIAPQKKAMSDMQNFADDTYYQNQERSFQCRYENCLKLFRYEKTRSNHEKKCHAIQFVQETPEENPVEEQDDVHNYVTARLKLGLLLKNVDDAVKEGDGERIILCWRFFLILYKAYGHHKYAIAAFHLLSRVDAIFTPMQAEQLIWNRTINRKGGKGRNISCDLRVEQLNCLTKELLHNLGVNLDEKNAKRESFAIGFLEQMLANTDKDLTLSHPKGHHKVKGKGKDWEHLVENLHKNGIFNIKPRRKNEQFRNLI